MESAADTAWITERANALGFDLCGVARAEKFAELEQFQEWLARGYAGEMRYLEDERRRDPRLLRENMRSVIVCALNYNTDHPYSTQPASLKQEPAKGWISRYAWGSDYHEVMWEKLNGLVAALRGKFPEPFAARAYADTGPIAERIFAKHAGLGWLGKNTLLLNADLGSWLFLGVILTSLELPPSIGPGEAPAPDLCGNCRQCLDACPTGALIEPYVLDARLCISYLTIELRGNIPEQLRQPMGLHVYGCDICQEVCPYNRAAPASGLVQFEPRQFPTGESLFRPSLNWLAGMSEEEFRQVFRGSAVKRAKWEGLVRNACVALGNSAPRRGTPEYERTCDLLKRLAGSGISTIAEPARWALSRI